MMTEGPEKTRPRWLVPMGVAIALLLAGVLAFVLTRRDPVAPVEALGAEEMTATQVQTDVAWSSEDSTLGGFGTIALLGSDGQFYALSTSPSVQQMPADGSPPEFSIYHSADGATWAESAISGLGDDLWIRNLTEAGGDLYVAGTAPSVSDPSRTAIRVGRSSDQGVSWMAVDLESEAVEPTDLGPLFGRSINASVVAAPSFVLAAAGTRFFPDYNSLVPPGILGESSFAQRTVTGVEVVDYSMQGECLDLACAVQAPVVVWSSTWAELGVQPETDAILETFVANDGGLGFAPVSTPFGTDHTIAGMFSSGEDIFVLVRPSFQSALAPQGMPLRAWRSPNGSDWEPLAGLPAMDQLMAFGPIGDSPLGDSIAVIGQNLMDPVVAVSEDGGTTWRAIDVSALLPPRTAGSSRWITAAGIGPLGAFINVSTWVQTPGPSGADGREILQLLESADLVSWSSTPTTSLVSGGVTQVLVGSNSVLMTGFESFGSQVALLGTRE